MTLRDVLIGCDDLTFSEDFHSRFWFNTEFINNWMSRNVRRLKIQTDGFKLIDIFVSKGVDSCKRCSYIGVERLQIVIHWTNQDIEKYLATKNENERTEIYLKALREGLIYASKHYDIHIDELLGLVDEFQQNGCKNEWLLRSMILKEWNVRLKFTYHITMYDFKLVLTLFDKKKNAIAQKTVFHIYPDFFWGREIRKVVVEDNMIYINDYLGHHTLSFDLNLLKDGIIEETLLDESLKQYMYEAKVDIYNKIKWLK